MVKLNFQHHYSSLQCHMILHSIKLICAQEIIIIIIIIHDYCQCWKQPFNILIHFSGFVEQKIHMNNIYLKYNFFLTV